MILTTQRHVSWAEALTTGIKARSARILSSFKTHRARRKAYDRALNELCALHDRELADIGIPRAHIRRVAWDDALKRVHDGVS